MKRLDAPTLRRLLETDDFAAVMIADDADPAAMIQAEEFALLWIEMLEQDRDDIAFRYLDSESARCMGLVSVDANTPAIAVVRDGLMIEMRGGPHARSAIRRLLTLPSQPSVIDSACLREATFAQAA